MQLEVSVLVSLVDNSIGGAAVDMSAARLLVL